MLVVISSPFSLLAQPIALSLLTSERVIYLAVGAFYLVGGKVQGPKKPIMATASVCGYGSSSDTVCGYGSSSDTVCGYGSSSETTATVQQQNLSYFPAAVDEERRCRACRSTALHVDWAQGDRICHNCGLVDSGQLMIDRPEWKDFNEAEDIVKGKESMARSYRFWHHSVHAHT